MQGDFIRIDVREWRHCLGGPGVQETKSTSQFTLFTPYLSSSYLLYQSSEANFSVRPRLSLCYLHTYQLNKSTTRK